MTATDEPDRAAPRARSRWWRRTSTGTWRWRRSGSRTSTCRGARDATFDGPLGGEAWSPERLHDPRGGPDGADRQPAHRGQPAPLPPRDRHLFGRDGAWGTWVHRWTAEEGRHGIAIRDYLTVTRAVDPVALERARMTHMSAGYANAHGDERAALAGVRVVPGAGHPDLAPQHRPGHRRPGLRARCWPGSPPTRTCTWSSTATCSPRPSSWPRTRRCGPSPTWWPTSRCPAHGIDGLRPQVGGDRHGRHLRPAPCTATRWCSRCCASGTSST